MPTEHEACLLLGSNIRADHYLPRAVKLLRKHGKIVRASSVWETPAVGSNGPNFLNAAVLVLTSLEVQPLKDELLHPIEDELGRVRTADKNAPRSIDIDLIFFDGILLEPHLWDYAFRAIPVAEILPDAISPAGNTLKDVAARLALTSPIRIRVDVSLIKK